MSPSDKVAEERLQRLLSKLPKRVTSVIQRLRHPNARWQRLPIAFLFLIGAVFSFLPVLGIWMLPVGLLLLAEDLPPARRLLYASVNWVARCQPGWFQ